MDSPDSHLSAHRARTAHATPRLPDEHEAAARAPGRTGATGAPDDRAPASSTSTGPARERLADRAAGRVALRRAGERHEVSSIWPMADDADGRSAGAPVAVHPVHGTAVFAVDGRVVSGDDGAGAPSTEPLDRVAAIFVFAGRSYLRVLGDRVLRNGRPVVGGLAPLRHGDWLTIAAGRGVHRYWLSAEGRRRISVAAAPAVDAMTLEDIQAGERVVVCPCGATYRAATWTALRRCCRCGAVEDGGLRETPPGWNAAAVDPAAVGRNGGNGASGEPDGGTGGRPR